MSLLDDMSKEAILRANSGKGKSEEDGLLDKMGEAYGITVTKKSLAEFKSSLGSGPWRFNWAELEIKVSTLINGLPEGYTREFDWTIDRILFDYNCLGIPNSFSTYVKLKNGEKVGVGYTIRSTQEIDGSIQYYTIYSIAKEGRNFVLYCNDGVRVDDYKEHNYEIVRKADIDYNPEDNEKLKWFRTLAINDYGERGLNELEQEYYTVRDKVMGRDRAWWLFNEDSPYTKEELFIINKSRYNR